MTNNKNQEDEIAFLRNQINILNDDKILLRNLVNKFMETIEENKKVMIDLRNEKNKSQEELKNQYLKILLKEDNTINQPVKDDKKFNDCVEKCMNEKQEPNSKLILENEKFKKLFNLKDDEEIINEEEIEPTIKTVVEKDETTKSITLTDETPKGYLKTNKIGITATTLEDQVINSRDIIKETLKKDLKK